MNKFLNQKYIHELKSKCTFKRGKLQLTDEEKKLARRALQSIWQVIGDDVESAFQDEHGKRKYPSTRDIIEIVLDAGRPESMGLDYVLEREATPGVEYLFRFAYDTETRGLMHKLAKEEF